MTDYLSGRQAAMCFTLYYIGTSLLIIPALLAGAALQDSWLAVITAAVLHFLLLLLLFKAGRLFTRMNMSQYMQQVFGKTFGSLLLLFFIIAFPFLNFVFCLRFLNDFITISIMSDTPDGIIYVLMLLPVIYVVRAGISVIGKSAEILFFIVLLFLFFLIISLIPGARLDNLLPVFEFGAKPIVKGSFPLLAFPYLDTVLFLFLIPEMNSLRSWKQAIWKSSMLSLFIYFAFTLLIVAVLNPGVVANLTFPTYFSIRSISISDFYERFEVLLAICIYVAVFFKLAILLHIIIGQLETIFQLKNKYSLLMPLSLIGLTSAHYIWPNFIFQLEFMNTTWPFFAISIALLLPLLVWIIGVLRHPSKKSYKPH